ncbi:hypothetical protein CMUS01_13683 [Colletotrichum musicola]|uniref:Uncharacterized protein n=1 Tax=Colletotrichum musicola TaxID=2175873 RepID=A0A8H6JBA6_9PEZI|nr:hypothetical protein CMUS01_13683 [Colletotrichum musicola]
MSRVPILGQAVDEAVRLYTEVKQQYQHSFSSDQQVNIQKLLDAAETALHKARTDQNGINREIERGIAGGMTMTDFHDAKMNESLQLPLDQDVSEHEPGLTSSQPARSTSALQALTDFDDDTSPLPLIGEFVSSDDDKA